MENIELHQTCAGSSYAAISHRQRDHNKHVPNSLPSDAYISLTVDTH